MQSGMKAKKQSSYKSNFSDSEIEEEIKDNIREIRDKGQSNVEEAKQIHELYTERKK